MVPKKKTSMGLLVFNPIWASAPPASERKMGSHRHRIQLYKISGGGEAGMRPKYYDNIKKLVDEM
jgi:hypothetical protein